MDKKTLKRIINYLEVRLDAGNVKVSSVILFGSQAKRESKSDSDIDLIIVSEGFRGKSFMRRVDMACSAVGDTIRHFHVPIDVLLKTPEEVDEDYLDQIGAVVFAA